MSLVTAGMHTHARLVNWFDHSGIQKYIKCNSYPGALGVALLNFVKLSVVSRHRDYSINEQSDIRYEVMPTLFARHC